MPETIEHDHHPEIVENGKGTRRLELLGIAEQLHNPEARRSFFAGLSNEHFTTMVDYVNSITRGQKIQHGYEDGKLPFDATPPLEDKARLMNLTFESVRQIMSDAKLDDQTALRRAGLAMAGAINFIHPYENGNGRSGRVLHYLIEFGTERGDAAFEEEMYALIAKLPVYDTDSEVSIDDTPPPEFGNALKAQLEQRGMQGRELASERVEAFLSMMRGEIIVPIQERVGRLRKTPSGLQVETIEPGQIDGVTLYERDYLAQSAIPNRLPHEVPYGAHRVMAEKPDEPPATSDLRLDLV